MLGCGSSAAPAAATPTPPVAVAEAPLARPSADAAFAPTPLCGDAREAAIRALVPEIPACSPALEAGYVAARGRDEELLYVEWNGGSQAVRGANLLAFGLHHVTPARAADLPDTLRVALFSNVGFEVFLDEAVAARALAGQPRALEALARAGALGATPEGLVAFEVFAVEGEVHQAMRYVASLGANGAVDVTGRRLLRWEGSRVLEGEELTAHDLAGSEPLVCLDGL